MRRGQYADVRPNTAGVSQMQNAIAQRSQHNSAMSNYPGYPESMHAEDEHQYMSPMSEGQCQWDRDGQKGSMLSVSEGQRQWDRDGPKGSLSSHMYKEGQGNDTSRSLYQNQRSDSKSSLEKYGSREPRSQDREEDMELGYEDNMLPQTLEGLEQKFVQDIMQLTKEQHDAEDMENARHRERLDEINTQYHERLLTMRARQAPMRDEFLQKESQVRHQHYQQTNLNSYQSSAGPSDVHGYRSAAASAVAAGAGILGEANRGHAAGHFENYGEQPEFGRGGRGRVEQRGEANRGRAAGPFDNYGEQPDFGRGGRGRGRGVEQRSQYPGGRAYNPGGRFF